MQLLLRTFASSPIQSKSTTSIRASPTMEGNTRNHSGHSNRSFYVPRDGGCPPIAYEHLHNQSRTHCPRPYHTFKIEISNKNVTSPQSRNMCRTATSSAVERHGTNAFIESNTPAYGFPFLRSNDSTLPYQNSDLQIAPSLSDFSYSGPGFHKPSQDII